MAPNRIIISPRAAVTEKSSLVENFQAVLSSIFLTGMGITPILSVTYAGSIL